MFTATVKPIAGACFSGWINEIEGLVASGNSIQDVLDELSVLLQIKLAIDYGMPIKDAVKSATNHKPNDPTVFVGSPVRFQTMATA